MKAVPALVLFVLVSLGGGALIGLTVETGGWYAALDKPVLNPPDWVFAPVWTVLYVLIGIAGWRVWRIGSRSLQSLWWVQLAVNFAWPPVFFAGEALGPALAVIVILDVLIAAFVIRAVRTDRTAGWLFVPYGAWTLYATLLNASLWWTN